MSQRDLGVSRGLRNQQHPPGPVVRLASSFRSLPSRPISPRLHPGGVRTGPPVGTTVEPPISGVRNRIPGDQRQITWDALAVYTGSPSFSKRGTNSRMATDKVARRRNTSYPVGRSTTTACRRHRLCRGPASCREAVPGRGPSPRRLEGVDRRGSFLDGGVPLGHRRASTNRYRIPGLLRPEPAPVGRGGRARPYSPKKTDGNRMPALFFNEPLSRQTASGRGAASYPSRTPPASHPSRPRFGEDDGPRHPRGHAG